MARPRCQSAGCTRYAVKGHLVCTKHLIHPDQVQPQPPGTDDPGGRFRARLEHADGYRDLLGPKLGRLMKEAAEEQSLTDELGTLRLVMTRVMDEEQDPARLAQAVSRLTTAAVQVMKAQRVISGQMADSLTDALTQILLELDAQDDAR